MRRALLTAAVLLLLPLVATAGEPAGSKKLTKADKKLQAEINLAIRKGTSWLLKQQERDGSFPYRRGGDVEQWPAGGTALAVLTLLHCGVKHDDRSIRKGFDFLRKIYEERKDQPTKYKSGLKVYETAITVMALAQLGTEKESPRKRRGKKRVQLSKSDRAWLQEMTDWLAEAQVSNGAWGYPYHGTGESNSQYAMLALMEARRMKLAVPNEVFEKTFDYWQAKQEKDGPRVKRHIEKGGDGIFNAHRTVARVSDRARGWGYRGSAARGSMTAAGVAVMSILSRELRTRKRRSQAEQAMHDGLAWLGEHFTVTENPGYEQRFHYYYLYGLERAGVLCDVVWIGGHRWYAEGARHLVDAQKRDGGWPTSGRDGMGVVDPCFALLFLARSTSHSYGLTVTPAGPVSLEGGDKLPPNELDDLFQEAFSGMFRLGEDLRKARAREFVQLGPRVIGLLLPKLQDPEEVVRDRAILTLRSITGKKMGYKPAASQKEREPAVSRWTDWYRANRRGLALDAKSGLITGASEASQIATGSVGESGASRVLTLRVKGTSKQVVVLHNCESSLDRSAQAVAQLIVNGKPRAQGDLTKVGSSIQVDAQPGDRVVATVNGVPAGNRALRGELHFVLEVRAR